MVESLKNVQKISVAQTPPAYLFAMISNRVMMLWGAPGVGKSAMGEFAARLRMKQIEREKNIKLNFVAAPTLEDEMKEDNFCFKIVYGSVMEETETRGLPFMTTPPGADGAITEYTPTSIFPLEGVAKSYGVIFFDELSATKQHIQSALQNVILEKKAGDRRLSDKWSIIAAGNRPFDGGSGGDLIDSLKNRLKHFELLNVQLPEWVDVMAGIGRPIDPHLSGFGLSMIGSKYWEVAKPSDPDQYCKGTPRTWEMASNDIKLRKKLGQFSDTRLVGSDVAGWLGAAAGMDFAAWLDRFDKINFDDLIKNPKSVNDFSSDPGIMYAIAVSLTERILDAPEKEKAKIEKYLEILEEIKQKEYGMFVLSQLKASSESKFGKILSLRKSVAVKYFREIEDLEKRLNGTE